MRITEIVWLVQFVKKIERKHGVSTSEVEQVFFNRARIQLVESGKVRGENLYRALGQTDTGRYLAVFFIYKRPGKALIISARDMSAREKKAYGKYRK